MLYNVVLISAILQHESAIRIRVSLPSHPHQSHFSRSSESTGVSSLCYTTTSR